MTASRDYPSNSSVSPPPPSSEFDDPCIFILSFALSLPLSPLVCPSSFCRPCGPVGTTLEPLTAGRISSFYYLSHLTVRLFGMALQDAMGMEDVLALLCDAQEFAELPVRHNEDGVNEELAKSCPLTPTGPFDSSHTKAHLLLQAHCSRLVLPVSDYITDTKSVLDQCMRVLQGMVDLAANGAWLSTTLQIMQVVQMVAQGRWATDSTILTLPGMSPALAEALAKELHIDCLPQLADAVLSRPGLLIPVLSRSLAKSVDSFDSPPRRVASTPCRALA